MLFRSDSLSVPVRPAATVMLVRDHPLNGLEVFMLQRTMSAVFAKGMYVFPGGRVDAADDTADLQSVCDDLSDERASSILGVASGGLAFWIAAIRECFEEAGVLLARPEAGQHPVRFDEAAVAERFAHARHHVHDATLTLVELCRRERLRLITDTMHYVSHWITPVGEPRRFDTRFFVAQMPEGQEPLHDDRETINSLWVTPRSALERSARGELVMLPPTTRNLEFLAPHATTEAVLDAARAIGTPKPILPQLRVDAEGKVIGVAMPGDADYRD